MTLIKTTKDGRKVEVFEGWIYIGGQKYSSRVEKLNPRALSKVEQMFPGEGLAFQADYLLLTEEEGLKAKALIDTFNAEVEAERIAKEKAEFEAMLGARTAFRFAEVTEQYGCELLWARRLTDEEKGRYSDWFQEVGVIGIPAGGRIKVEREAVLKVVGDRPSNAQFLGCSNNAWEITEDEWKEIVRISKEMARAKEEAVEKAAAEEEADLQQKVETGYCFNCESWCHGDCGNYSNDPKVLFARELKRGLAEDNG